MLLGSNLNELFLFPVQNREARKHFLTGCLVYLTSFFIPILPWLVIAGYSAILIRQVLNGEKPHLVPWEDWERLLKDGARLVGVRLIYSSPVLILIIPFFLVFFAFPFVSIFAQNNNVQDLEMVSLVLMLVSMGLVVIILPLSLIIGLIVPAAEVHVVAQGNFAAGFQVREWWPIFKRNLAGFILALVIMYALVMAMSMVIQFMFFTIVLACLFPLLIPVISMYSAVVQYVAFAQAYKEGKEKLQLDALAT